MSEVYGYVVIDKDGKRAVYDTKNAAAVGFYHISRHGTYYGFPAYLEGKKLSEQDVYRVVGLVAQEVV